MVFRKIIFKMRDEEIEGDVWSNNSAYYTRVGPQVVTPLPISTRNKLAWPW